MRPAGNEALGISLAIILAIGMAGCAGGGGGGPKSKPPAAPTGVTATSSTSGEVTVDWAPVAGATAYNIYWGTSAGVTKDTGTVIPGATAPFTQTGAADGTTHYYVVTALKG